MNFTVQDNFLDADNSNHLYCWLVAEYALDEYKSTNFYDSKYDGDKLIDILIMHEKFRDILLEKHSNRIKYSHIFGNCFTENSRNIGIHSCRESSEYYTYMLCRHGAKGGDILFPESEINMHMPSQINTVGVKLKHNRLIKTKSSDQRMMDYISLSNGPVIYINILK